MKKPIILVVDDSHFMRNLIGNTIKDLGYDGVYYAEDGFAAVEKAGKIKPDVVTLDVSMPGMDGIEAVKKILEVSPSSRVVMVSAVTSQIAIKQALQNGAKDFIKKPVDRTEIENMLNRFLTSDESS